MQMLGIHPANPAAPIDDKFALELIVVLGLIAFFILVRLTFSVEKPNPAQQIAEVIHEFTGSNADQIIGHGYERFQAFVTCIFLFVVINNLLGLIPGLHTPTGFPVVPLGIALVDFSLLQLLRSPRAGHRRLYEAFCRPGLVDRAAAVSD